MSPLDPIPRICPGNNLPRLHRGLFQRPATGHRAEVRDKARNASGRPRVWLQDSARIDLPAIRISASFANVSTGLRRPPSWIASNPHCLKSKSPVSPADALGAPKPISPNSAVAAVTKIKIASFQAGECNLSLSHVEQAAIVIGRAAKALPQISLCSLRALDNDSDACQPPGPMIAVFLKRAFNSCFFVIAVFLLATPAAAPAAVVTWTRQTEHLAQVV